MEGEPVVVIEALAKVRRIAKNGQPYWYAREIMPILAYDNWANFRNVIEKAKAACEMSGHLSNDHFVEVSEMVGIGSGAKRQLESFALSKYACYLIAMNGESSKPEIATAQTYFVEQTHLQEVQHVLTAEERRLLLRNRVKDANKKLSGAALAAGVGTKKFGIFHDAGYKGLYAGLGVSAIKRKKGIAEKEDLLDCIEPAELAANEFRITQAEQKLRNNAVVGEQNAIDTHYKIGQKVRKAIEDIGGTMPERLPAAPSIKKLAAKEAKKLKSGKQ